MGQERGCKFARRWWDCFLDLSQGPYVIDVFRCVHFLSLEFLSHCSKDMKQWTSVIARLQLNLFYYADSRSYIHLWEVRGGGPWKVVSTCLSSSCWYFLSPSPEPDWFCLCKVGLAQAIRQERWCVFFPTGVSHSSPWIFPLFSFSQAFSFLCLPFSCQFLTTILDSPFSLTTNSCNLLL